MKITCYDGMGYIYLKASLDGMNKPRTNNLSNHLFPDQISIPYITDIDVASYLDKMSVAANTLKADYELGYDTEYGNDMDKHGYITGIELTLHHDRFIELIQEQAYKVIQTDWRNKKFHLVTFDDMDNVFKSEHVLYKLTEEEDAFVIVQLVEPKKLGHYYMEEQDRERPIALFKALISAREDIYPLEYLLKPNFLM